MTAKKTTANFARKIYAALKKAGLSFITSRSEWNDAASIRTVYVCAVYVKESTAPAMALLEQLQFQRTSETSDIYTMTLNEQLNGWSDDILVPIKIATPATPAPDTANTTSTQVARPDEAKSQSMEKKARKILRRWCRTAIIRMREVGVTWEKPKPTHTLPQRSAALAEEVTPIAFALSTLVGKHDEAMPAMGMLNVFHHGIITARTLQAALDIYNDAHRKVVDLHNRLDTYDLKQLDSMVNRLYESSAAWIQENDPKLFKRLDKYFN